MQSKLWKGQIGKQLLKRPVLNQFYKSGISKQILNMNMRHFEHFKRKIVRETSSQFHHHFISSFFIIFSPKYYKHKLLIHKMCTKHFLMKKMFIKCWWNWHVDSKTSVKNSHWGFLCFGENSCVIKLNDRRHGIRHTDDWEAIT